MRGHPGSNVVSNAEGTAESVLLKECTHDGAPLVSALHVRVDSGIDCASSRRGRTLLFHYVPVDDAGNTKLQPTARGPGGAGEKVTWVGLVREPTNNQPRPTHLVTFRHPFTNKPITVPLALSPDTPRMHYWRDRVVYDYGSNTVEAKFHTDGSVDVIYNSGLLRPL